jgi:hypothetical protein
VSFKVGLEKRARAYKTRTAEFLHSPRQSIGISVLSRREHRRHLGYGAAQCSAHLPPFAAFDVFLNCIGVYLVVLTASLCVVTYFVHCGIFAVTHEKDHTLYHNTQKAT